MISADVGAFRVHEESDLHRLLGGGPSDRRVVGAKGLFRTRGRARGFVVRVGSHGGCFLARCIEPSSHIDGDSDRDVGGPDRAHAGRPFDPFGLDLECRGRGNYHIFRGLPMLPNSDEALTLSVGPLSIEL